MDGETPASGTTGTAETTTGTETVVAAPETTGAATSTKTGTSQPEPQPAKPDIASLLKDPDYRKLLLSDPDVQREIEHRASSEAGRRAKAELDRWQRQQDIARQQADLERLESLDEYEAGVEAKKQAAVRREQLAQLQQQETLEAQIAARIQPLREQEYAGTIANVYAIAQEAGATDEELAQLDPRSYPSFGDFLKGAIKLMGTKEGKKLAKDMAKVEAKAMVEEMNRAAREGRPAPEALPPTGPTQTDDEFMAEYASGRSDNSAIQIKWMQKQGLM